ncbi:MULTISPECIES: multidrug effflux MFS transporter [Acinetobacter]|uniref:Bcr/CflA family efflux transporter n=1 Tax=Acinetobacter haemolyticus TaxID=29430 RepID=A0AAJ2YPS5_ACIHA|nr:MULTISPECIES: multidrug effflux MFS transporter [Acinetobacter]ATZ68017.1 Bcr/CflA family drug resistance efflux transporter [Acinetobacter haemolyticus]EEH69965.1 drug resistance transporter, Bcr/CflA subfamily [Acinetobacter sp. ATCC 27244]NAR28807.1 Bcr/CflA family efflux MFS transporter [Acinetobacter haemolyticus]NAR47202.1 Bcr/CflA family efflux MFS transporter [Acinetobacter haemolyticus]NAR51272.1 Bcr/CflA family efflux MFS transporter [Acinetobacter haemolyticus]
MQVEQTNQRQYSTTWIMLLALLTALGPLSIDMYLPALPQMADEFGVSTQMVANTLPAYFLGLAIGQLFYGPVSDRIGRKTPLYFGLTLYVIASLACVLVTNEWALIIARIFQALGGCVGVVIARAAIRDRLDVQGSAQAFSSMMIVMGLAPILAPIFGAWILIFFPWQSIFVCLAMIGVICGLCVHFFFKESLPVERRLKLSTYQVTTLYAAIFKDQSFRLPMLAGCLTGAALFCYISSASAVFMGQYGLSQQHFSYAFAFNAAGIMLMSSLNKHLNTRMGVFPRLVFGGSIQCFGAVCVVSAGLMVNAPLWFLMSGLFLVVSGIGLTGPNAMALAMSEQGARAGTASAIMGSMQFACGLLGGVILNFLVWKASLNMGLMMLMFTSLGLLMIFKVGRQQRASV